MTIIKKATDEEITRLRNETRKQWIDCQKRADHRIACLRSTLPEIETDWGIFVNLDSPYQRNAFIP